jgi:hypothetical protein
MSVASPGIVVLGWHLESGRDDIVEAKGGLLFMNKNKQKCFLFVLETPESRPPCRCKGNARFLVLFREKEQSCHPTKKGRHEQVMPPGRCRTRVRSGRRLKPVTALQDHLDRVGIKLPLTRPGILASVTLLTSLYRAFDLEGACHDRAAAA